MFSLTLQYKCDSNSILPCTGYNRFGTFFGHFENLPLLSEIKPPLLTLKDPEGADSAHRSGDRLPFLTGSCYGHKIS